MALVPFLIRIDSDDLNWLKQFSADQGVSTSMWVRVMVRNTRRKHLQVVAEQNQTQKENIT